MTSLKQLWVTGVWIHVICMQLLFAATPEQVEQYLSISNAEEELLQLESDFSSMQNGFSQDENASDNKTYDMQLLSLRFKEYIQTHLSENEMAEILQSYKSVILLQFTSATLDKNTDLNATESYIKELKEDPEFSERLAIIEDINTVINNEESMSIMFDGLVKPLLQSAKGGKNIDDTYMKQRREAYMKRMIKLSNYQTLYASKDFSIEALNKLLEILKTPAIGKEIKVLYGATAYALNEFFLSIASRYDISKH